jgi:short/branched chain acyl-CoA dehydrogenase
MATEAPPPVTTFTEEEELMRQSVARFAGERVQPLVKKMDDESQMDPSIISDMFDQGLMAIEMESEYGGSESTFFAAMLAIEELAKVDASVSVVCDVQNTLILDLFRSYASKRLKEKYFPRLATNLLGCYCLSEPQCGSDAFALTTRADKAGDQWVLNGQKAWITNAEHAGLFIVMANVDFSKGYKGITAFVADREMPGLTVGKKEDKLGIRASSTCPVFFENVKVPEENVIGEVGKGYKYAIESLNVGRIGIGAQMLGVAKGCLESVLPYVHDRMAFGQPIADFQAMQHQRAQLATDIEAASLLVYNTARLKDRGLPFIKQAAMTKFFTSEVASKVTSRCVEMLGGVGFTKEFPTEKFYRDSKIGQIYEGSSFIQLNTIAKCMDEEQKTK